MRLRLEMSVPRQSKDPSEMHHSERKAMMMRRYAVWAGSVFLLALIIGFLISGLNDQIVWGKDRKKFSKGSKATLQSRKELIDQELQSLPTHPWAGRYYYGDGLGVNVNLSLAPKSGFAFTWNGCLGLYDLNYGDVVEADGRIRLIFKHPNDRKGFQGISPELIPIVWGERHYLVSSDEVVNFANAINAGFEPSKTVSKRFLLREGDELKAVHGQPDLPSPYSEYLLKQPITAEISSVKESRLEDDVRITTVTLNVGSAHGVKPGMEFYVYSPASVFEWARITTVNSSNSEAKVVQRVADEKYNGRPSTDWKLSTSAQRD